MKDNQIDSKWKKAPKKSNKFKMKDDPKNQN